jgi:Na+-translocating ferredoxin:NAD+ oxidoreductase RnfG subunit
MIGALIFDRARGKHEFIDYAIALTPGGKVRQIEILEYRESWGSEVRRDNWRRQFVNKHSKSKLKLHDGIHNISGATISVNAVTRGIHRSTIIVEYLLIQKHE